MNHIHTNRIVKVPDHVFLNTCTLYIQNVIQAFKQMVTKKWQHKALS